MKKIKCEKGHYYDADRFSECPLCEKERGQYFQNEPNHSDPSVSDKIDEVTVIDETEATLILPDTEENVSADVSDKTVVQLDEDVDTMYDDDGSFSVDKKASIDDGGMPDEEPDVDDICLEGYIEEPYVEPEPEEEDHTLPSQGPSLADEIASTYSTIISPLPKTVAFYDFEEIIPPVGWIVGIKGKYQGQAFECKAGKNKIGRGGDADIDLKDELSVSRGDHCYIIYEPEKRRFFIQAGNGKGLTYLNDDLVFSHDEIHAYDSLRVGNSKFVFIPLCGERFTWDDYIQKDRD